MMRSLLIFFLFLMFPLVSHGQADLAKTGTPYSSIAFGEPTDLLSPGTAGMGLTGVSIFDPFSANSVNPALWGSGPYTQGNVAFGMQNFDATDGMGAAGYSQFTVNQFQVVLPIVRSRFGLSAGFFPVTRSSFDLSTEGSVVPESDPVNFLNRVEGSGGVNKMELGFGMRITDNLTAGYAASINFATINREFNTVFDSADFSSLNYTESMSGNSIGHRFGIYGRKSGIFGSNDQVALGAALTLPVNISAERSTTSYRDVGNQLSEVELLPENSNRTGDIQLPLEINLGLTYNPSPRLDLALELQQQMWGDAEFSFNPAQEQYFTDRSKIGIGTQYRPYLREGMGGFFSNFKYSAGATYDSGHLMIENQRIETLMFHTGIGVFSRQTSSSVDLSFQLGFRGTEAQNLIKETIWGFKLSVNLAEWMFQQSRFQ